jgi:hypothetical protein
MLLPALVTLCEGSLPALHRMLSHNGVPAGTSQQASWAVPMCSATHLLISISISINSTLVAAPASLFCLLMCRLCTALPSLFVPQVAWQRLRQYMEDDVAVEGTVVGTNRGGILVDIENIRGFCPGSQLGKRVVEFEELMNLKMNFKVGGWAVG